jgi:hypothetical protein
MPMIICIILEYTTEILNQHVVDDNNNIYININNEKQLKIVNIKLILGIYNNKLIISIILLLTER